MGWCGHFLLGIKSLQHKGRAQYIVESCAMCKRPILIMNTMKFLPSLLFSCVIGLFSLSHAMAAEEAKAATEAKPDLAKGEASFANCAACHGADGNSSVTTNPKLAHQHPEYLLKQLQEFKSGKRANAVMTGMAATLSDDDMKNVAAWLSTKEPKHGFAKDKELVALGERIYKGGVADRQIAACAGCHSPTGAGIPSQYPRLSGQHQDYTVAQLNAFRGGVRNNSIQMSMVAAKLNDKEIQAVADYIAGLH